MNKINYGILLTLLTLLSSFQLLVDEPFKQLFLTVEELPEGYKSTNEINCKSIQASILYEKPETYAMLIGKVKSKSFQSFKSKKDSGSILYLEFEEAFDKTGFLEGLLWGGNKPTSEHPEEYQVKDNILIIWSLSKKSEIKNISKKKVLNVWK
ncbi:MAG: hypothetical protein OCD76_00040 [Reichenbachiella sp.]